MTITAYENDYGDMCPAARKADASYRQWYEANEADAEIARLRALVREAYDEGGDASTARGYLLPEDWDASNAKKALGP